jgi:hypothetical protein
MSPTMSRTDGAGMRLIHGPRIVRRIGHFDRFGA